MRSSKSRSLPTTKSYACQARIRSYRRVAPRVAIFFDSLLILLVASLIRSSKLVVRVIRRRGGVGGHICPELLVCASSVGGEGLLAFEMNSR